MTSLIASPPQLPAEREAHLPAPVNEGPRAREIIGIILQRLWLALGVGFVAALLVLVMLWRMTPTYVATGSVMIEPKRENLAKTNTSENDQGLPPDTSAIDSQVEVLKSPALAEAVTRRLKLYDDPEFNSAARGPGPSPAPSSVDVARVAQNVLGHTRIKRVGLTYVVNVGFAAHTPLKAERIANAYMDTYLQRQLDDKIAAVTKANTDLGGQVERLREEDEAAQARLAQYKIDHNLFSAQGATMAEQEVSNLNQQIAQARADAAEKQARLDAAMSQVRRGGGGADVGAAVVNDTIRALRQQEAEKSQQLAQLQAIFQPEYPEVQKTQAELNDIRTQIQAELNRILSSVHADAQASAQREGSLIGSRGSAQGGLVANNKAEVGMLALQQRADAAKQIYEAYLNRANLLASEGSLQQSDAVVTSLAALPLKPTSPNMRIGAALAILLGLLAGGFAVFVTEMWDRRLRSRGDVEARLGVPFAGVIPQVPARAMFSRQDNRSQIAKIAKGLIESPYSSFAESFRNLRAFLTYSDSAPNAKVLGVTSSVPREGKTISSLCLARTLAFSGARVVVIDCDLRKRGLSQLTGHRPVGLVEVIQGKAKLDEALICDRPSGAWILPSAPMTTLPHDLFSDPGTDRLFENLAPHFDQIILELPPVLGLADARILAAKADRVLYLIQWNKTPARTAQSGLDVLHELGANVVGAALTQVNIRQQARYGYCDSSDYFSYFTQYYMVPDGR
ncbi:MAG: AAA family ATPase [Caulobacteraceae bacterium]|nr:AAA family ATPase [Caulobacteraceae bacterium]